MNLVVIAIRDTGAGVYNQPNVVVSRGAAIRSFRDLVNDPSTPFSKHPKDYHLCVIGAYDDNTGELTPCKQELIARGEDMVDRE